MKPIHATFIVTIAVIISVMVTLQIIPKQFNLTQQSQSQSVYDRVMESGKIRCAYTVFENLFEIDPKTGEYSGIYYDVTMEIARRLNLEIDWVEEVNWGNVIQGYETNRYDLFCNAVWPTPERGRKAMFSQPIFFQPVWVIVRADDDRFTNNLDKINAPNITIAIRDGDITESIKNSQFPLAKEVAIPELTMTIEQLMYVATGKADVTFNDPTILVRYNRQSNAKLKTITAENPIQYFPSGFMVPKNEPQFKSMLDTTIASLHQTGFIEKTIQKYEEVPGAFYRVADPFKVPEVWQK